MDVFWTFWTLWTETFGITSNAIHAWLVSFAVFGRFLGGRFITSE